jgi:hypothetical protein
MAKIGRAFLAILAGEVLWTLLWVSGTMASIAVFGLTEGQPITSAGVLVSYIVYSSLLSVVAGYVVAALGGREPMPAVWVFAFLQLALGIFFQTTNWRLFPIWYHLIFLALVVPTTLWGASLRTRRRQAPAGATT